MTGTKKATFGEEERLLELFDEESGKRLMDTLTGVLNLSRLEAGEMDLGAGPVDLAEQAEKIAEELRPRGRDLLYEWRRARGRPGPGPMPEVCKSCSAT